VLVRRNVLFGGDAALLATPFAEQTATHARLVSFVEEEETTKDTKSTKK
jgi:hypothetical protein